MKYLILILGLFLSSCSPYLLSNADVRPGDTVDEVIAVWGEPRSIERQLSMNNLGDPYELWTYGLPPTYGDVDYRTYLLVRKQYVQTIRGYKVND